TGDQSKSVRWPQVVLMQPEGVPEEPAGATAHHRRAEFATGDDAELRSRAGRQRFPIGNQTTCGQPLALLPEPGKITPEFQAHGPGKTQRRPFGRHKSRQTGVRRLRPARRRFRRMARPPRVELRLKKPCCRLRRIFDGWYWRFMR